MPTPLRRLLSRDGTRLCQAAGRAAVVMGAAVALLLAMPLRAQVGDDGSGGQGQAVQADPPSQVARVSVMVGNVSVEPASVNQFSAAEVNYPLTTGDRLYADVGRMRSCRPDSWRSGWDSRRI